MVSHADAPAQVRTIREAVAVLHAIGQVVELRAIEVETPSFRRPHTVSGYFEDHDALAREAGRLDLLPHGGIFVTLNRIDDRLLARRHNRTKDLGEKDATTADSNVLSRQWLPLDFDPNRPAGVSSTDDEHLAAIALAHEVRDQLRGEGWPNPILGDSGNGAHLLYRIELPADDGGLVQRALEGLSFRFATDDVGIDLKVANPARIWKLYGTTAKKGDSTGERPHRLANLQTFSHVDTVSKELLEAASAWAPHLEHERKQERVLGVFDLEAWVTKHLPNARGPAPWQGGRRWVLPECPWDSGHRNGAAYVVQLQSGAIAAGCHHNGCNGNDWRALRDAVEPGWREQVRGSGSPPDNVLTTPPAQRPWPLPPRGAAFAGLAGRVVEFCSAYTEGDPVALLLHLLVAFGNVLNSGPHAMVGATRHSMNLFTTLVGDTAKARKGDSWSPVRALFDLAEREWVSTRVVGGLSTGEGLIWAVRDPVEKEQWIKATKDEPGHYEPVIVDEGVKDKRLMVIEPEFARVLKVSNRPGNTLSPVIRAAWDNGRLQILTKTSPAKATDAHISVIGHITVEELRRELTETDAANGLGNRFLWACVRRSKMLPEPPVFDPNAATALTQELREAVQRARKAGPIGRSSQARQLWADVYPDLSGGKPGLAGALTARAEAQVLRLSALYALLDRSRVIEPSHLHSALELWAYCERSVDFIFGDATGDAVADAILGALRQNGELSRTQISELFGRHESSGRINQALQLVLTTGKARTHQQDTGGRPREMWVPA